MTAGSGAKDYMDHARNFPGCRCPECEAARHRGGQLPAKKRPISAFSLAARAKIGPAAAAALMRILGVA